VSDHQPVIELQSVSKIYGSGAAEVRALDRVDLTVREGEFVAVMGSSGSGKSTCLNVIGCLDTPTLGEYFFRGLNVGELSRDELALIRRHYIGFVFQSYNLLPRMNAVENVELPLIYRGFDRTERRRRAIEALRRVGLSDRAAHTPSELSGGQQQRVSVARALVTEPRLLLADEPTGNLDTKRSAEIMEFIRGLNEEQNLTIVMVTHEPEIAAFAERVVTFRDGRIISDVRPGEAAA
jgi:putative ABC transport system ATP-binding protein